MLPLVVPVLLPGVVPVLEPGVVGVLDEVAGELLPALAPLPLVMPSSFRHFSRSAPNMPRHLLLLVLPLAALPEALLPVLGEVALGRPLAAPAPGGLALEGLPYEEPELCA